VTGWKLALEISRWCWIILGIVSCFGLNYDEYEYIFGPLFIASVAVSVFDRLKFFEDAP